MCLSVWLLVCIIFLSQIYFIMLVKNLTIGIRAIFGLVYLFARESQIIFLDLHGKVHFKHGWNVGKVYRSRRFGSRYAQIW
jgi:hypothetical protein